MVMEVMVKQENKVLKVIINIIKIASIITYVLLNAFLVYSTADAIYDLLHPVEGVVQLPGLGFAIVVVIIGGIGNVAISLFSLIGLILGIINKHSATRKKNIILFLIGMLLPILTEMILILIGLSYFN
jgi:hypothetical protein